MKQRRDYEQKLQAIIDEWAKEIEKLRAKAEQKEEKQLDLYNTHEQLRSKHAQAQRKLNELIQAADESSWEKLKTDVDKEIQELDQLQSRAS